MINQQRTLARLQNLGLLFSSRCNWLWEEASREEWGGRVWNPHGLDTSGDAVSNVYHFITAPGLMKCVGMY